jgi:predicted RNA-binding protein Jag
MTIKQKKQQEPFREAIIQAYRINFKIKKMKSYSQLHILHMDERITGSRYDWLLWGKSGRTLTALEWVLRVFATSVGDPLD